MSVRERQPHHHVTPGRLKPLAERKLFEQPATTLPSWNLVCGILDLRTRNKPTERKFIRKHRTVIKAFYDAKFSAAIGKEQTFVHDYQLDPNSEVYNPDLIERLSPFLDIVKDRFPQNPTSA